MEYVKRKTGLFAVPILLFVAALFAGRLYFLLIYSDVYAEIPVFDLFLAFAAGLRFDLSTACVAAAPFLLFCFIPGMDRRARVVKALLFGLLGWYVALLVYNFSDILYYAFTQRHLTYELKTSWGDLDVIIKMGTMDHIRGFIGLFIFIAAFVFVFMKAINFLGDTSRFESGGNESGKKTGRLFAVDLLSFFIFICVSVILMRGGFQMKPLGVKNAFKSEKVELGALSLNGIYTTFTTLFKNFKGEDLSAVAALLDVENVNPGFAETMASRNSEEILTGYPLFRRFKYSESEKNHYNVVIFIMESWSAKHIGSLDGELSAAPNFDDLAAEGLLFTNCFANGQRSVEGLAAVLGSIPVWKGMVLGQSPLLYQTRMETIGGIFRKNDYETFFFHGARPGSLGFDSLIKRLGFERHISMEDFNADKTAYDGVWGIFDENLFLKAHELFSESRKKPFFAVIYSLTSHMPYSIPSDKFKRFGSSTAHAKFLNSMWYSDYALGRFFEEAKKEAYFKDTIFVITGDHTEGRSTNDNLYESYRIPCLFYGPGIIRQDVRAAAVSQIDIVPTLIDLLKFSDPFTSWGKTVLDGGGRKILMARGGMFVYLSEPHMILTDLDLIFGLYDYAANPDENLLKTGNKEALETSKKLLGELRQYLKFSYDLITENRISPPGR